MTSQTKFYHCWKCLQNKSESWFLNQLPGLWWRGYGFDPEEGNAKQGLKSIVFCFEGWIRWGDFWPDKSTDIIDRNKSMSPIRKDLVFWWSVFLFKKSIKSEIFVLGAFLSMIRSYYMNNFYAKYGVALSNRVIML